MKRGCEREALLKSFFIFFIFQLIFLFIIYNKTLSSKLESIELSTLESMKLCSYTLNCKDFNLDFVKKSSSKEVVKLIKEGDEVYSLFHIPQSDRYFLKLSMANQEYQKRIKEIRISLQKEFLIYALLVAILSFLFSLYSIYPLKRALKLNENFMKDILHDYNTPISSLLINFKLLKKDIGENRRIERIEKSIKTLLMLQNNLRYFLSDSKLQKEIFTLDRSTIEQIVEHFKAQYPDIEVEIDNIDIKIKTNREALIRILDNIISNAFRHNIKDGHIRVYMVEDKLYIENSSRGVKNPHMVFSRYYKEGDRGVGIGLDIVKKLSLELEIDVKFYSQEGCVRVVLDMKNVTIK